MKRKLARALRRTANRIDPTPNSQYVTAQNRVAIAQRDLDAAQQRQRAVYERFMFTGSTAGESFGKSRTTKLFDGIASASPALPNAGAIASKAPWWRRLLRRFGR